jgi:hypothetical protein
MKLNKIELNYITMKIDRKILVWSENYGSIVFAKSKNEAKQMYKRNYPDEKFISASVSKLTGILC